MSNMKHFLDTNNKDIFNYLISFVWKINVSGRKNQLQSDSLFCGCFILINRSFYSEKQVNNLHGFAPKSSTFPFSKIQKFKVNVQKYKCYSAGHKNPTMWAKVTWAKSLMLFTDIPVMWLSSPITCNTECIEKIAIGVENKTIFFLNWIYLICFH